MDIAFFVERRTTQDHGESFYFSFEENAPAENWAGPYPTKEAAETAAIAEVEKSVARHVESLFTNTKGKR